MSATRRNVLVTALVTVSLLAAFVGPATAGRSFSHRLTGEAEVPGPGDANGRGRFTVTVFPRQHMLCYRVHWEGIKSPMMAHVHKGRADVAGPVRVTLFSQTKPLPDSIHTVKGCVDGLRTRLLNKIRNHPARYYVNVHNRPFPGGAIRGQLV